MLSIYLANVLWTMQISQIDANNIVVVAFNVVLFIVFVVNV